ncbi:MAG TPA: hybrid sensor histidine kinase/response regulator [Rubrivivax sp.]|jgi:signal transduction histidine kinase/ActR/RegA family two-component response regulator|nr:hybrid sensor histidine kinase/response regulator [Rubrivivax sp.]
MSEQGRAAEGPQGNVSGRSQGWEYSPDAGETARAMTATAVASAVANVPLLLAAVALVVYMAFEAGLNSQGAIFGALGLATSGWRWSMRKRYRARAPFDEATDRSAQREVELNAGLSGLMWAYGALSIYPHLREVAQIAYPMLLAGSAGVAALYAPLAGRAYLYMIVPQVASLVAAHLAFDGLRSIGLAAIVAGFGFTMHRSAQMSKAAGQRLARALLERDRLRADHARLAELELTEAKLAAESARNEAAANRDLFIAKVSHEFRTPLQTIVALADLLALKTADERSKGLQEPVQRLSRAADQLMHQATDLAAFVRANQAASYEIRERPVRLDDVVATSIIELRELANRKGVDVRVSVPAISLQADDMRLQQIIGNLVSNAVKYTSRGHIEIRAEVDDHEHRTMTLCVSDTGSGIPAEVLPDVFEPWFRGTREARGLGLGLSIVRSLVAQLGGTAEIKSDKGTGTTACVRIPVKVLPQRPHHAQAGPSGLSDLHILVIDDEDSVRGAVADLLRAKGATCVEAPGTEEALLELSSRQYEVALVDIQMPGADGYELARRLKARHPDCATRLIAMSAFGLAEDHGRLFDAYVAKPSKADTMVSTIIQTLGRGGAVAAGTTGLGESAGASRPR